MWKVIDTQTGAVYYGFKTKVEAVIDRMEFIFSGPEFSDEDELPDRVKKALETFRKGDYTEEMLNKWADEVSENAQSYEFEYYQGNYVDHRGVEVFVCPDCEEECESQDLPEGPDGNPYCPSCGFKQDEDV